MQAMEMQMQMGGQPNPEIAQLERIEAERSAGEFCANLEIALTLETF
jgi:hypothetical protein